jgi:UDP-glucose 6-dehydrogenase
MKNINFSLSSSPYDAVKQSDIVVITADRPGFVSLDSGMIRKLMNESEDRKPVIFDLAGVLREKKWDGAIYISYDVELHPNFMK